MEQEVPPSSGSAVQVWRRQLIQDVLRIMAVLGFLVLIAAGYHTYSLGAGWKALIYAAAYVLLILTALWPRAPYIVQVASLLSALYGMGVLSLATSGLSGDGKGVLLALVVLTVLLGGWRWGLFVLGVCVVTMAALGGFFSAGSLGVPVDRLVRDNTTWSSWISTAIIFLMLGALLVLCQAYLFRRLLAALAQSQQLASSLEAEIARRKQVEEALRHRMGQLTALGQASQTVTASLELDQVLTQVVPLASQVVASQYVSVALVDEMGRMTQGVEDLPDVPSLVYRIRDEGLAHWITRFCRPVVIDEIGEDGSISPPLGAGAPRWANPHIVEAGVKSVAGMPLMVKDNLLGVLFFHSLQPGAFRDQLPVLISFANQVAIAIENARLYQAEHESRKRTEALHQATQAVSASLELGETLRLILEQLKQVLVYDTASVLILCEGDTPDLVAGIGFKDEQMTSREAKHSLADSPILRRMAQDLQPVVSGDVRHLDGWIWVPGAEHVRSWLAMPLVVREQMIGVLMVDSVQLDAFGKIERQVVQTFAQHAAQAIQNARLMTSAQEQARQVRQVMDTVPEGVLLLDARARIVQANPVAEEYLVTLVGRDIIPLREPLTRLGNRPLAELLTSPPTRGLWHEVKADGRTFEVIARPIENGPEPEHWVLVINDVTQEREIRAQLYQQERLAAVGQLAAGIAHDFNNIMATIVLYAQMAAQSQALSKRDRERMAIINQQAWHAARLIQQILDFSRRAVLECRPLDLLPLLKEQVKLLERTLPEHIEIVLDYGRDEYTINADPTRMQQMITNLAVNARDAMLHGGVLHLKLERSAVERGRPAPQPGVEAGEWVRLTVSDTGTGILPDALPHIFEPFFTTKDPGQGSGLGLAQVHGIVGQHGGHIGVETQVGAGTTFTIYLPALVEHPAAQLVLDVPGAPQGQGETVLVVEDGAAVRAALVASLEEWNYRVLEAVNGREALALMEERGEQIALVVSDVVMPEIGGIALFHALREKGWQTPVILLTGHPMGDELDELRAQGLSAWLTKPPSIEQLAWALGEALRGS